jgi:hypothetical protein
VKNEFFAIYEIVGTGIELERMWMEGDVAYFKLLPRHLPGETSVWIASLRAKILTLDLPDTKQEC